MQSLPSSNWRALQKSGGSSSASSHKLSDTPRKRRKLSHVSSTNSESSLATVSDREISLSFSSTVAIRNDLQGSNDGESLDILRKMVSGDLHFTTEQQQLGKYLAIDCEMVGLGIDGSESSLARVSLVNYHGVVQLDEFVKQREKVVDYRTQYSGIRDVNMVKARPFEEVQKRVAELLKDRVIIGHAVHNDLKALLLSHSRTHIRDTQVLSGKFKLVRSKYIALRNLVKQELDLTIQNGEHSSVTDARAAMAIYRLHRNEWEKGLVKITSAKRRKIKSGEINDTPGQLQDSPDAIEGTGQWWKELGS